MSQAVWPLPEFPAETTTFGNAVHGSNKDSRVGRFYRVYDVRCSGGGCVRSLYELDEYEASGGEADDWRSGLEKDKEKTTLLPPLDRLGTVSFLLVLPLYVSLPWLPFSHLKMSVDSNPL